MIGIQMFNEEDLFAEYIKWKEALHSCSIEGNALARKVLKKIKGKNIIETLKIIKENFGNGQDK